MFNTQAIVLKMVLVAEDRNTALLALSKLKKHFFSDVFSSIYTGIQTYYNKHHKMPTLDALMLENGRNAKLSHALAVLSQTRIPDVEVGEALCALENEFAQNEALRLIEEDFLKDLPHLDKGEVISRLNGLAITLEDKVSASDKLFNANNLKVFSNKEVKQLKMIPLGLSNSWDADMGGIARGEVILIGGYRGTGKSIVCSNIQINQYYANKIAPYFSIEMSAEEVFHRNLAIMAGVPALNIRNQSIEGDALLKLARTRAAMFHGGEEFFYDTIGKYTMNSMSDFTDMEDELNNRFELHTPMIIVRDINLSPSTIDVTIANLIARYGEESVTVGVVDYLNQLVREGVEDRYDWKEQMVVATSIKNIATKHNVGIAMPMQVDQDGQTRMSKGIMDSADISINLNAAKADNGKGAIIFECTKARGLPDGISFTPAMDWTTLKIDGTHNLTDNDLEEMGAKLVVAKQQPKPQRKKKESVEKPDNAENSRDI
ncbi:ATP-dependent DNA helicase [Serratia phage vB_SmaM-Kamaji]|nr:ATP-dependent DNA helicase [Serratia phage vB_SmaM-Kamaji]